MSDANFTLGPWNVSESAMHVTVRAPNGEALFHDDKRLPKVLADAHLISAAPDLYDALLYAVDAYGKPGGPWNVPSDPGGWLEAARSALKKARGDR